MMMMMMMMKYKRYSSTKKRISSIYCDEKEHQVTKSKWAGFELKDVRLIPRSW